jgi:type IV secretory pathway VirB10-like protein
MENRQIHSPVDVDDGGWRGKVAGVSRIGARAGYAAAFVLAALVVLIVYGISTAGHRRATTTNSAIVTKAPDQQKPWWDSVPNAQPTVPALASTAVPEPLVPSLSTMQPITRGQRDLPSAQVSALSTQELQAQAERSARERVALGAAQTAPITVRINDQASSAIGAAPQATSIPTADQVPGIASGQSATQNFDARIAFFAAAATSLSRDQLLAVRQDDPSPYELHAGSVIPATLVTGINADLPGTIVGQVRDDVFDSVSGQYLLIPRGTKLVGTYDSRIVHGQRRLLVAWTRLLYPDGSSLDLSGMAGTDPAGYAGFGANVDDHLSKTIDSALLLSIISAGAQLSQPQRSANVNGVPDIGQTIAGAIGQQIGNTSIQLTQRQLEIPPTLEVPPGYIFDVLIDRDIVMSAPYADPESP